MATAIGIREAREKVRVSKRETKRIIKNASIEDIIKLILLADRKSRGDTARLAKSFRPTKNGLHDIWRFVRRKIRYIKDGLNIKKIHIEKIKSPAATLKDGYADCKSMSILIASILYNLGIRYEYRFTSYRKNGPVSHVYIVAFLNGEEYILDAVHTRFNDEVPYKYALDYKPSGKHKRVIGIGRVAPAPSPWSPVIKTALGVGALYIAYKAFSTTNTLEIE